jgi:hypothetical protein
MKNNQKKPPAMHLTDRAQVVIFTDQSRHSHATQLLKGYLPECGIEVWEISDLFKATSKYEGKTCDGFFILADSSDAVPKEIADGKEISELSEDAFLLRTGTFKGFSTVAAIGGGIPGVIHAINELGMRQIVLHNSAVDIPRIDLVQSPSLPYRLLWTWDHSTNWYLEQVGIQEIGALNYYSKPPGGFLEDYRRLVDFMSMNRIGGVTIYGFLRDSHGGIDTAQELCRYAFERGVRILPGVGINAYGGIYWEGKHRYNLTTWLREHPQLRAVFTKPVAFHIPEMPALWFPETPYTDAACPSKPENARYHEEAIQWLTETFQIGGINFETGDYGTCNCNECSARRRADETWSLKDVALLYPRLFEAARRGRSDLWLVSEAYWDNILNLDALAPLLELPDDAIYQFCINRSYWPQLREGLTSEHVSKLPRSKNILRTHMGSQWNSERYELVASRFADMMKIIHKTGMQGATIFGEAGSFNVANEINYLAFARFGYDSDLTWERFLAVDLGPLFGGKEASEHYLRLLTVPTDKHVLIHAVAEARERGKSQTGEAYRRWIWLQNRLYQKLHMIL